MVSTLHITLVNNQPSSQWLGRSASCEETNLLGFSSTLTPTSKTTSLSTSSVLRPQAPGTGVTGLSTTHGLVTPTPYSPSAGPRASSWSPVRLKTKPLPDFLKKLNPESAPVASPGTKTSWCRAAASQGPGRPGVATSTGDVKVGQVSPTLAARWPHAAKSDSSKPEVSPRADRKVLGIPVSSAAVSSVTVSQVAPPGRPPTPQGERRRLSGGSPSMTRKEVSPAPTNDPSVKSAAEPSRVLHEASSVADQNTTKSDQLDEPQGSSRRSSLDSAKKESPTVARKLMSDTAWLTSSNRSATLPALKTSSAPWQQRPNRLSSASLQRFEDSVHSGGGREGVGGGVMEDGGPHTRVAPASSTHRKANSLPGYYSRGSTLHQPSFREAFNTSKSPTPPARNDSAPAAPPRGPTSPRTPRVVAVPSVPPQQQRQQQHHQQQQNSRQHQNHHKQKQQQSTNQLQEYQKQHQQQLQQQLRQKQLQQQQQQQLLWQQHQQQQRLQESHRQNAQQQIKSQRQPKLPHQGTAPPISQGRQPPRQEPPPPKPVPSSPEKKNKKSILSGIFRRRKKGSSSTSSSSSDSSSSDNEEPPQRRSFLRRRSKKKEKKDPILPAPSIPPAEERLSRSYCDFPDGSDLRSYRRVRVVPVGTGSLGKETQPLGIPTLTAQPGQLNRLGVSASHDSLPLSLGSWTGGGSHASLGYYSGGGMGTRSSSTDTISKKERREALKARVERLRERIRDTSSDEEKASVSSHSMYGSESSLSKTGSLSRRSRAARTERFLRRKSYELETLRNETEKDRRNREAVQARIEEIQRVREFEAKRNKLNEERKSQSVPKTKPRWSAKLVYQESSEYESSVLLRTPSVSPSASPHMKAKFDGHAKDGVVLRNKPRHVTPSVAVSLPVPSVTSSRRSFQDFDTPTQNTLRGHRSASYDSNINRNSFVTQPPNVPITSSGPTTNRSGLTPPAPPPRDRSRILSPCDGRPMSFSFESLNQEAHRPTSSQSSMSNFTKGSSPSPSVRSVPAYLGPRSNPQPPGPQPMLIPTRRSYSELELSQQQQMEAKNSYPIPPSRPAPPGYPNSHYSYTDQPPRPQNHYYRPQQQQQPNQQVQYYTDQSPQHNKTVPISSVPASPSSDYSSYMSDNSIKLQQANTAWRQKEQEIKNKISVLPSTTPAVISDSSPSNSPKLENGVACSPGRQQQQGEGIYGKIEAKKIRPEPITLKQAESFSSLSGQSDVSSPVPRGPDSDSSQGSLARDKKKQAQNRPLSMVLEKAESGEKETPPGTPKARPQPPLRSNWQPATPESEAMKRNKFKEMIKHKLDSKTEKNITPKEFEDMFQKEKEKLENSKSSNFEEALKELEEIYASLRLDSEDLLDGAERRDLPVHHQTLKDNLLNDKKDLLSDGDSSFHDSERTQSLSGRRSGVPDAKGDDMHFRRCQQSTRNQPDVQKALQMTGSYLLVSPAHVTPSDLDKDMPKDPMMVGEPDVVYDDVSYRNIKKANSIKIIDPQPPFGIPLGPTTQASQNDYLHVTPKENYRPKMTARKQPDTAMDDLAFRNLRKDKGTKEVNTSELDELLCEARAGSPRRRTVRSSSADRAQSLRGDPDRGLKHYTPRQVKHQQETRRVGSQKDNMTDTEVTGHSVSSRHNPSWLERAHLLDPKWDMSTNNLSTSTETLTELSSARAVSQPDIRRAIIREARAPPGGPEELLGGQLHHITASSLATPTAVTLATITVPRLVKVHTVHSAPASPVILDSKTYKPLDSIFNSKPKPFYLTNKETEQKDSTHEQGQQQQQEKKQKKQQQHQEQQQKPQQQDEVDIAKLDALISTLSKIEGNDDLSDSSDTSSKSLGNTPPIDFEMKELKISEPALENVPEPQTVVSESSRKNSVDYEYNSAKANIEKAIRLSMALESYNSEGKEVCSRRRSAVDLPVRESLPSHGNSSISSTNVLSLPSLNPVSNDGSGGAAGSRTLSQSATPQAVPAKASTCTDKVESMVVVSQQVHGRARRSRSVPTSPRTVDTMPLLGKTLTKPLINEAEVSTDGEVECGSECEDSLPSGVSASLALSVQGGDALAEILSPSSCSTVTPNMGQPLSKQQTSSNQNLSIACETQAASQPLSSKDACALADYEIVECESSPASVAHSPATKLSSTAKAPAPPVRLSSLPPSPTLRGTSSTSRLSEQPSLSCDGEVRQGVQAVQRLRGASVPLQQQDNRASDSEGETCDGEVRAGSLPPALLPPADSTGLAQGSGPVGAIGPRSCVPGEGGEFAANGQDNTCFQSLVAACYLLACVTQLAGVDVIAAFGLLLAIASVIITFAR